MILDQIIILIILCCCELLFCYPTEGHGDPVHNLNIITEGITNHVVI